MAEEGLKEKDFEADIEAFLLSEKGGYVRGNQETYDKDYAIDTATMVQFLRATQPKEWKKYELTYGADAEYRLKKRFNEEVNKYGLIAVLRRELCDHGVHLRLCYFAPTSEKNEELVANYKQNILTCTRQFAYSTQNNNTIDMVLALNGIPVIAIELKNQFTGQSVENSKRQWREDRNPNELLFHKNKRILAYFGVDLYNAVMTTELKGASTFFMPFDQGSGGAGNVGGAGNPEREDGHYVTAYLWERVLQRDMLLSILQRYVMVQREKKLKIIIDKHGKEKETSETKETIIFPRYHQLDAVERLVDDTLQRGAGHNYLVQHSAGSGKSNSIAWLTYRLATLHDGEDRKIFDGVFVVTDRRVLNRQLQETILSFDHEYSQVVTIDESVASDALTEAIENEKQIIVTTLQRFPYIYETVGSRKGKRYAIVVDEAHSSQSGKSAQKLNATLADTDEALEEWAKLEEKTVEEMEKERDKMMEDLLAQGRHGNLSFYAFTATPKPKTIQTFGQLIQKGEKEEDNRYGAFHTYSMQQAIEEGFILDVLKCYTPYGVSFEIEKSVKENPEYEEPPAVQALLAFHKSHQDTINKKAAIIVEKFREVTLRQMGGRAKAMVVSASRMHALRLYLAVKDYCKKNNIADVRPLVAFSGSLKYGGTEYTEPMLNSTPERKIAEERLPLYFASELYNMLIVADKYQTGFDEPMLHTMFVDKKLRNVKAVQTLSRLNRAHKGKRDTYVFDFANDPEDIQKAFEPFYTGTELIRPVDVNYVYNFRNDIRKFHLWTTAEEDEFYEKKSGIMEAGEESRLALLSNIFKPVLEKFGKLTEDERFEARNIIKNFVRFYAYMEQIARTYDKELYKAYIFADYLYKVLPKKPRERVDLNAKVMLLNSKIKEEKMVSIALQGKPTVKGENPQKAAPPEEARDLLDNIIAKVNALYHGNFTREDRVVVESLLNEIQNTAGSRIAKQAANNDEKQFVESIFPTYFKEAAVKCYDLQRDAFVRLFEKEELFNALMSQMGAALYASYRASSDQQREGGNDAATAHWRQPANVNINNN